MKANYNVNRKELTNAISRIMLLDAKYLGAPTFAYEIGPYKILKDGTVESDDDYAMDHIVYRLAREGIERSDKADEGTDIGTPRETLTEKTEMPEDKLSISLPKEKFTPEVMTNFINLVAAKQELLKQALKTEDLSIVQEEDKVTFPWFTDTDPDATYAHMLLITKMVEMATNQKRISAKPKEIVRNCIQT